MDAVVTRGQYDAGRIVPLLTFDQAAERLAVSTRSVRRLVEAGYLPVIRVGGLVRLDSDDLERYIERAREAGEP